MHKEIKHNQLGNLYCKIKEKREESCWAKQTKISIFNRNEVIEVLFDLYCFNEDFQCRNLMDGEDNIEKIIEWYKEFLNSSEEIESTLWREYNKKIKKREKEKLDISEISIIKRKEDLGKYVKVEYAVIYINAYALVISVPWEKEKMTIKREEWYGYGRPYMGYEKDLDKVQLDFKG